MSFKSRPQQKSSSQSLWLYGDHAVRAAWQNRQRACLSLLVTKTALAEFDDVLKQNIPNRPTPQIVEREKIDRLFPPGAVHQGLALSVKPLPETSLDDLVRLLATQDKAKLVVLDQVNDPHNVGAVLRSAAAFGAASVIVQDRHAPEENGVLAKSASGALELVPIIRVANIAHTLKQLKEHHVWIAGFSEHAQQDIQSMDWPGKVALCLGNEGTGLRRLVAESCDFMLRLPTSPEFPSLNISNAAAIALYELEVRG